MHWRPVFLNQQAGFSFLQTVLAIVVIAVVAAVSIKPLNGLLQRIKLQTAANGIKHMVQNARIRSMANPDRPAGVVFRFHGNTSIPDSVFTFLESSPPDKIYTRGRDSLHLAPFIIKTGQGVVPTIPGGFPSVVVFRGDGSASSSVKVVLTINTMQDTLDVLASTGRVKVVAK